MFLISYLPTVAWIQGFCWLFCGFRKICNHCYQWCSWLFFSGIGAVASEVYLPLRTCWLRSSSLVIRILTSSNFFSLAIQRSVTYGGENNEVISMNNLNGIAERFGGKENFEQTQLFEIYSLDRSLRSSIYNLHFNRNRRLEVWHPLWCRIQRQGWKGAHSWEVFW